MFKESKIYIAGSSGLLGRALIKELNGAGYKNLLKIGHDKLDLLDKVAVFDFFAQNRPDYIFLAAGKVSGIAGNRAYPADYLHVNIGMQDNIFEAACEFNVKNVVFYGSSCSYPKFSEQPIKEEYFLTGAIEPTSQGYAAAKIAGIIACRAYNNQYDNRRFIALLPNSMYGAFDNFDLTNSHVLSALMRRFYEAKVDGLENIELWGSGNVRREFIFSEDVARASIFAIDNVEKMENSHYNVGSSIDYSIKELAEKIAKIVGYRGQISWDISKPDGTAKKLLDSSRFLELGWKPEMNFDNGLAITYNWFKENYSNIVNK